MDVDVTHETRMWCGTVRFCSRLALGAGAVLLSVACSFSATAPQQRIVSITSSQDTMSIGALRFTGTIAIIDTTLQVSVVVKNDSSASVPYNIAACGGSTVGLALYRNAARSGTPVLDIPPPPDPRLCPLVFFVSLAPGDSVTLTNWFFLSQVREVPSGVYYVGATPTDFHGVVKAGTIMVSN